MVNVTIAVDVTLTLRSPVFAVRPGIPLMVRACVPEAPVDEHNGAPPRKENVHADGPPWQPNARVLEESIAEPVELCTEP
jgi:hypothetical protein